MTGHQPWDRLALPVDAEPDSDADPAADPHER